MPENKVTVLYAYFTAYYFAQGCFQAYSAFEQPYLESFGVGLEQVALAQSLAQLPWIVKIIFAVPSDMYSCWGLGFRRPYAVVGLTIGAAFLAMLGSFNPGASFGTYVAIAIIRNTGVCISDVSTDGMAVDCGLEEQSGLINSFMTCGRMLGLILGSKVAGSIAYSQGFGPMLVALSLMIFCVLPLPVFLKEERKQGHNDFDWRSFKQFQDRTVLLFLFSTCCSNMGLAIAGFPLSKWLMNRFGATLDDVGTASAIGSAGLLVGSIANGYLFDRVGKRLAMWVAGAASSATLLGYLLASNTQTAYAARFFAGAAEGALWIVQAGLTMRLADKRTGASFFALAIMAMNFAIMLGQALAGPLAERVSLEACFWAAAVVSFAQLLPLPWLTTLDAGLGGDSASKGTAVDSVTVSSAGKGKDDALEGAAPETPMSPIATSSIATADHKSLLSSATAHSVDTGVLHVPPSVASAPHHQQHGQADVHPHGTRHTSVPFLVASGHVPLSLRMRPHEPWDEEQHEHAHAPHAAHSSSHPAPV